MSVVDIELKQWATEKQGEYIDVVNQYKGIHRAADALGVSRRTIDSAIQKVKEYAGVSVETFNTLTARDA